MPLDGSYIANEPYRVIEIAPDRPAPVAPPTPIAPLRRREIKWLPIFVGAFVLWVVCWTSEVCFHDRGIFTLVFGSPTLLRENDIARSVLYGRDAHKLEFTVAGQQYTVISPGHQLTAEEQTALLNYAARNKLPMWTADGQFAVDP